MQYFLAKNYYNFVPKSRRPNSRIFLFLLGKSLTQNAASQMPFSLQLAPEYFFAFTVLIHQQLHVINLVPLCSFFAFKYYNMFPLSPTSKNCCTFSPKLLLQVRYFYPANYYSYYPIFLIGFSSFHSPPFCSIICSHLRKRFCCIFAALIKPKSIKILHLKL